MVNSLINRSTWTELEVSLDSIENTLSNISSNTVIFALVAGPLKILMGTIQLIAASLFFSIAKATEDTELEQHCWEHMKHGIGNMLSGIIETIPIVATFFNLIKGANTIPPTAVGVGFETTVPSKWQPYETIVKRNLIFSGSTIDPSLNEEKNLEETKMFFDNLYPTMHDRDLVSLEDLEMHARLCLDLAEVNYPLKPSHKKNTSKKIESEEICSKLFIYNAHSVKNCDFIQQKIVLLDH